MLRPFQCVYVIRKAYVIVLASASCVADNSFSNTSLGVALVLGKKIKAAMEAAGIRSEGELARLAGVPQPTIHRIINGTSREPRRHNLEKIAEACRVPVEELLSPVIALSPGTGKTDASNRIIRRLERDELEFSGSFDLWDGETPLSEDEVALPLFREVELAAGSGQTQVIENHGPKLRFAKSTLRRKGIEEQNAACAYVKGNSMDPVLPDGTTVGVNTADKEIRDGKIYAIDHDGMLRIKYLYRRPGGGIKVVSQNSEEHPTEEYTADETARNIRIIGRVFWWSVLD